MLNENQYDNDLKKSVAPNDWINPHPNGTYNLVVIGGGTAGLVCAVGAAKLGAKVALVEKNLLGGDCLNVGCVPSKGIISSARVAQTINNSSNFGVSPTCDIQVDFNLIMSRMRRLRSKISKDDAAIRFKSLGIDVYFGQAKFLDPRRVSVSGTQLTFRKAVIATGARASAPSIEGLETVNYLTNETVFDLTEIPKSLGIIGAGPIGCEMAQTFASLGVKTYLVESKNGILSKDDRDAAKIVREKLESSGVEIICCGRELKVSQDESIKLELRQNDVKVERRVAKLLVAVGRTPNVEGLDLDKSNVKYDKKGINVDKYLRTTNRNIYAAGDVCSQYKFTHAADFMARLVIQNALFFGRKKLDDLIIPWSTYTTPEVSHVGLTLSYAQENGIDIDTYYKSFGDIDRAVLEEDEDGFVKIITKKGSDKILGATIVAKNAGDLISSVTMAMKNNIGLSKIANVIHPYPTQAEVIRKIGDDYNSKKLTPFLIKLTSLWFSFLR